jgi:hypothetical protein
MNRLLTIVFLGLITMVNLSSCKSRKPTKGCAEILEKYPDNVLSQVTKNMVNFDYLSLRIKANYNDGDNSTSFGMNVKMQKDSFLWASITAVIEVARAHITSDSFTLIDRLNKKYYTGSIQDLKQFTGQEMTLGQLQALFIGNPLYAVDLFQKSNDDLRNDFLQHKSSGIINRVQLSGCFRSLETEFQSDVNQNAVNIDYSNFTKETDLGMVPNKVNVDASGDGKKFNLQMEYSSISPSEFEPIQFVVPSKYEKAN